MRVRAVWRGTVLADSADTVSADAVVYFPAKDVAWQYLRPSAKRTMCPWKGVAAYYTVTVGDVADRDAAWTYHRPWASARRLRGRVAFGGDVTIETTPIRRDR
ncbi:DUF427 domain-containing protein [Catellatospora sichuanensis]|uniref:DUF427 domain-containing protein n=1 Tax=Catellatospora sichuanensis TaxID=1969805 RepID=UPI001C918768|nr:DUF427 domain-containing protein [Catellatospora sichuanensis]